MTTGIPSHFAHYEVIDKLGYGGFGNVYLASDAKLGNRLVVLKVLHPHLAVDPDMVRRFRREAQAMGQLDHPNIVRIYSVEDQLPRPFIVMEFVPGITLATLLLQGVISFEEALPILHQIAEALDAAHLQGMVHRDVKPSNVLITAEGVAKLTDFGIVKMLQGNETTLTPTIGTMGSVRYMSPEQVDIHRQDEIGPSSDIYTLGVMAYRMLAGRVPFEGQNNAAILIAHMTTPPPDPSSFNLTLSPAVVSVLMNVLDKKPKNRYPTASAFIYALQQAVAGKIHAPYHPPTTPEIFALSPLNNSNPAESTPSTAQERTRRWATGLSVLVLLLVGVILGGVINEVLSNQGQEQTALSTSDKSKTPFVVSDTSAITSQTPTSVSNTPIPAMITATPSSTPTQATQTPSSTPTIPLPVTEMAMSDGMVEVYVPAGEFLMGSAQGDQNEQPEHLVYLDEFWIDQTEVTNAMYRACVDAGSCDEPTMPSFHPVYTDPAFFNYPIIHVSWHDAQRYCEWAERRLPTEAEWEKAARGTLVLSPRKKEESRIYPWGNSEPTSDQVNLCDKNCSHEWKMDWIDDGYPYSAPVGSYPAGASPYGALDMAGNVLEWVADWYDEAYYLDSQTENPTGAMQGNRRVKRGGAWSDGAYNIRVTHRESEEPSERNDVIGFRCARTP